MRNLCRLVLFLFLVYSSQGQSKKVKLTIQNDKAEPISFASVVIEGKKNEATV